jgi:hypothetical protein
METALVYNDTSQLDLLKAAASRTSEQVFDVGNDLLETGESLRRALVRKLTDAGVAEDKAEAAAGNLRMAMVDAAHACRNAAQEVDAIRPAIDNVIETARDAGVPNPGRIRTGL